MEALETRFVLSTFTTTSPTRYGPLPANVTPIGGIVIDLVGLNGRRIVSQLPAAQLFKGMFNSGAPEAFRGNPGTIGIQTGWTPALLDLTGGGLAEAAVRLTLLDGDSGPGNFDSGDNTLLLNGVDFGDFSAVSTEHNSSDGKTTLSFNPDGGFRNDLLDTGFFFLDDPTRLAEFFDELRASGELKVQLRDADPNDNNLDFTAGLDGGLIDEGTPPTPPNAPPTIDSLTTNGPVAAGSPGIVTVVATDPDGAGSPLLYAFDLNDDGTFELSNATGQASVTFASPGSYPIRVRVTDAAGDSAEGSIALIVQATAPTVTPGSSVQSDEGDEVSVPLGSFADATAGTLWTVRIDWRDGSPVETFTVTQPGDLGSRLHRFRQDGTYKVQVRVTGQAGLSGQAESTVNVSNVAPVVTPADAQTATRGVSTRIALGAFADPGPDAPWLGTIDWGDGSPLQRFTIGSTGNLGTVAHAFARHGQFQVTVTVADRQANHSRSFVVRVPNLAPVIDSIEVTSPVAAGDLAIVTVIATDPDGDGSPLEYRIDLGDGSPSTESNTTGIASAIFATPGVHPVSIRVIDAHGGEAFGSAKIIVRAVPPVFENDADTLDQTVVQGESSAIRLGRFSAATVGSVWTVEVDWGDGSPVEVFTVNKPGDLGTRPHVFTTEGESHVQVYLQDERGLGVGQTIRVRVLAATTPEPVDPLPVLPIVPVPRPVPAPLPGIGGEGSPDVPRSVSLVASEFAEFADLITPTGTPGARKQTSRTASTGAELASVFSEDSSLGTKVERPGLGSPEPGTTMNLPAPTPTPEEAPPLVPTDEVESEATAETDNGKKNAGGNGAGGASDVAPPPEMAAAPPPASNPAVASAVASQNAAEETTLVSSVTPASPEVTPAKRGAISATITMVAAIHCRKQWGRTRKMNPNSTRNRWR